MAPYSARALGFEVGQLVFTGAFPAVITGDAHTSTPLAEVWGLVHETGGVAAGDLEHISTEQFIDAVGRNGHPLPLEVWSDRAQVGLEQAGVPCVRK